MTLACKTAVVERDVAHLVLPDEVQELPAPDGAAGSPGSPQGVPARGPSNRPPRRWPPRSRRWPARNGP